MIFSENRFPLFAIMLYRPFAGATAVVRAFGCAGARRVGCRAHCAFMVDQFE